MTRRSSSDSRLLLAKIACASPEDEGFERPDAMIDIRDGSRATQIDLDPIAGAEIQQSTAQEGTEASLFDASRAIPSPDWFSVPSSAILCLTGFRGRRYAQQRVGGTQLPRENLTC
jgi:hypothetical protein